MNFELSKEENYVMSLTKNTTKNTYTMAFSQTLYQLISYSKTTFNSEISKELSVSTEPEYYFSIDTQKDIITKLIIRKYEYEKETSKPNWKIYVESPLQKPISIKLSSENSVKEWISQFITLLEGKQLRTHNTDSFLYTNIPETELWGMYSSYQEETESILFLDESGTFSLQPVSNVSLSFYTSSDVIYNTNSPEQLYAIIHLSGDEIRVPSGKFLSERKRYIYSNCFIDVFENENVKQDIPSWKMILSDIDTKDIQMISPHIRSNVISNII